MYPLISQLISHKRTSIATQAYAPCHVKFNVITDIDFFEGATIFFIARPEAAMSISKILKIAFSRLIADRAIGVDG